MIGINSGVRYIVTAAWLLDSVAKRKVPQVFLEFCSMTLWGQRSFISEFSFIIFVYFMKHSHTDDEHLILILSFI
jgi:predicted nucleic-acid-binding protein